MKGIFSLMVRGMMLCGLAACASGDASDSGAASGPCFATDIAPALIETETILVLETPEILNENGDVTTPAVYRSEVNPRIVRKREALRFEIPCEVDTSPEFVATLQRALKARGHFSGPVTGVTDDRTKRGIRSYQTADGLNSNILSLAAAQELGLIAYDRDSL
ncbi:MAG: peptidoglycan-binding domain-containing protein [Paracoccaceae bacterium]